MKLDDLPKSFRFLITVFLLCVGIGYVFGILNIYHNTGFSYTGLVVHYRGEVDQMTLPSDFVSGKLIHQHHVHIFSLAMLFFMVGAIFTLTRVPDIFHGIFISAPFLGMFLDFTSFWLLAFKSPIFAALGMIFGGFMGVSFFLLILRPLYEIWVLPIWHAKWGENVPKYLR